MFLEQTMKRNKALIETAFRLHKSGLILPDSYVIDVDSFLANAKQLLKEANRHQIRLYFMLKQVGRNPYLAGELVKLGYPGAVVVDFKEAQVMMENQIPIGNVGHLVQVPESMIKQVVDYSPEVITVFSMEKIRSIDRAAGELGKNQGIMLRVYDAEDMIYSGQTAGFCLDRLEVVAKHIVEECANVTIKGVTSFPCYLYNEEARDIQPTTNLNTVLRAKRTLENMGVTVPIVNTPSATCSRTLGKIAEYGGNCGEPGHGLSGTTPMHVLEEMEEIPSVVYVSEISHSFMGGGYCYGGGHYRRSHMERALVGASMECARNLQAIPPSDESIDYHFGLSEECRVGDTAVMAFRFQIFVTRSDVVLVRGVQDGNAEIVGVYDSLGRKRDL